MENNGSSPKSGYLVLYVIGILGLVSGLYLIISKGFQEASSWSGLLCGVTLIYFAYQNRKGSASEKQQDLDSNAKD